MGYNVRHAAETRRTAIYPPTKRSRLHAHRQSDQAGQVSLLGNRQRPRTRPVRRKTRARSGRDKGRDTEAPFVKRCSKCGQTKPLTEFHPHKNCKDCQRVINREYNRAYRERHPDRARQSGTKWRAADPERNRAQDKRDRDNYRLAHLERERLRGRLRSQRKRTRLATGTVEPSVIATLLTQPCAYCGSTENITIDHIVPLARGGTHEASNLAPACFPCNSSKRDRLLSEWTGRLAA